MIRTQFCILNFLTGLLLLFSSCSQPVKEVVEISSGLLVQKIDVEETRITKDSLPVFKIVPAGKPETIPVGKPTISQAQTNISTAGTPVVVKAGTPQKIIPGTDGIKTPVTTSVEIRKIPCKSGPAQEALNPAYISGINSNMKYLDIEQGMASGYILTMYQDKKGNTWFGTNGEGVLKYDGKKFFQYSVKNGLPNNYVRCIVEDKDENFWFGTDGGLVKYDGIDFFRIIDSLVAAGHEERIDVRSLVIDKAGTIWIGTAKYGAFKFDGKSFTNFSTDHKVGPYVSSIIIDRNDNLWFGSNYNGVAKYDGQSILKYMQTEGLINNNINCLTEDAEGNIWIGSAGGVSKFDKTSFTNFTDKEGLCNNNVSCILQDSNKNFWFGTDDGGACKYNGKAFSYFNIQEGFRSNLVRCMMQDKSHNLFFGTYGGGVMIMNENNFVTYGRETVLNHSPVLSINEDNEGSFWFGAFDGAINKYDGGFYYSYSDKEGFHSRHMHSVLKDKKGNIWFGSESNGLYKYDGKTFTLYTEKEGLIQNRILELYEDKKGNLWIGTLQNGISMFDGKTFTNIKPTDVNGGDGYWSILEDNKGNMWFGSHNGTLVKYDGNDFFFFSIGETIYSLVEDAGGNIWMGNDGPGLIKYDGNNFYRVSTKDGGSINQIRCMVKDKNQNLWIGTEKGLKYFENPTGKPGIDSRIFSYSLKDGLPGEAFQQKAAFIDSKEKIWLGTDKGVVMVNPKIMNVDTSAPVVRLSDINIYGRTVDFHHLHDPFFDTTLPSAFKRIKYTQAEKFYNYPVNPTIPFKLNHLTFNLTVSDPEAGKKAIYQYMLENLDEKWSEPSSKNSVDYRNIPYGDYIFKVKAIGAAQKWGPVFEYPFTIKYPWWHSWWFRSIVVFVLLLTFYLIVSLRTRSLRERQKYLQLTVEKRTEQLSISLTEKEALLKEIHHRVKNNLEVISSLLTLQTENITDEKARAALTEGQSRIQSIALIHHKLYRNDEMGSVELGGFAKDLFKQVKDVFNKPGTSVELKINNSEIWLSTDAAVPFGLILNELFTNAFKYAVRPGRENIITVLLAGEQTDNAINYTLVFRDNGPGMPAGFVAENSTSLGMKVILLLTQQLEGSMEFYNENGTVFNIHFIKKINTTNSPEQKTEA